jgi:septal ring-binding cell division protein DamX
MTHSAPKRAIRGRRRFAPFALAFSALALAACGSATKTTKVGAEAPAAKSAASTAAPAQTAKPAATTAPAGAATTTAPATAAPVAVPPTLDFTATLVGGGTFDAKQYAGKQVAFWFWAPT